MSDSKQPRQPMCLALGIRAQGRREYEAFWRGEKLAAAAAVKAKCYDCMGGYNDGKDVCGMPHCPLYPYMPFRSKDNPPPIHPRYLESLRKHGHAHKGRLDYERYLKGERITRGRAIYAKCLECNGGHPDGYDPCNVPECPLLPYVKSGVEDADDGSADDGGEEAE